MGVRGDGAEGLKFGVGKLYYWSTGSETGLFPPCQLYSCIMLEGRRKECGKRKERRSKEEEREDPQAKTQVV